MGAMPPDVKAKKKANELTLAETLHDGAYGYPGQQTWLNACLAYQTVVIACGRRIGKTTMIPRLFIEEMTGCNHFYHGVYVAQGHPQAKDLFRACLDAWEKGGLVADKKADEGQDRWIEIHPIDLLDEDGKVIARGHGGRLWFISGEQNAHRGFHGKGLDRAVIDEACLVPRECLTITLRPMLITKQGKLLVTGSPFPDENGAVGWDWFEKIWNRGNPLNDSIEDETKRNPNVISFTAPTEANPYNSMPEFGGSLEFCREMRSECSSHGEELSLYDGRFARDLGAVFQNLDSVFVLTGTHLGNAWQVEAYDAKKRYVAGLDFGAKKDYSVLSIFTVEPHPRQVFLLRIQGDLHKQMAVIDKWLGEYGHPMLYVEGREGGRFIAPMLREKYGEGCREVAWASGGEWDKESSVLRGVDFFQQRAWSLINVPWQREEFRLFSRIKRGPNTTGFKYSAPSGAHDDSVAATLYAAYGLPFVRGNKLTLEPERPKTYTKEWWDLHVGLNGRAPARKGGVGLTF